MHSNDSAVTADSGEMSEWFSGKVVAITGAGKGLGRAYALHLAALGANIVVNNRCHAGEQQSSADRVVAEILDAGGRAVADYSSVEESSAGDTLLAVALDNFGRLDGLVANAGINEGCAFKKNTLDKLREVIEINLMGTINVLHPVFRHFSEQQSGSIVVSTSSSGLFGEFGLPAYAASKGAIIALMQSLSLEGAPKNVWVNAISPYAATNMTSEHLPEDIQARMAPEQAGSILAWLLSRQFGGEIVVAGGDLIARARMYTSAPMPVGGSDGWPDLKHIQTNRDFDCASDHFRDFIA